MQSKARALKRWKECKRENKGKCREERLSFPVVLVAAESGGLGVEMGEEWVVVRGWGLNAWS